jgi:uncharacterized protein YndB with AHSA1/START domain
MTWLAPWDGNATTTVTWRLEPVEEGTRLTLRHEGFAGRPDSCRGHGDGWVRVLDWLGGYLTTPTAEASYFLCRLIPPRATFPFDMSAEEGAMMGRHADYWRARLGAGGAIVFGPVADPAGPWGLGVLRAADRGAADALLADDPAITSGRGFRYEVLPLMSAMAAA